MVTVLKNGLDALTMMLATYQIGVYLVPVNWHFTTEEIDYIVADCQAKAVISPDALTVPELIEGRPATPPPLRKAGSMMLYTSGTTGRPKGVRRRLLDLTPEELYPILMRKSWRHFDLPMDGVHLVCSQLYHSAPYGQAMMALQFGHAIVAPERFEAAATLELIERHRVTNAFMVPTMFHRMLDVPDREKYDLSSLTHLYHGAAPCPPATKKAMIDWLGPVLWGVLRLHGGRGGDHGLVGGVAGQAGHGGQGAGRDDVHDHRRGRRGAAAGLPRPGLHRRHQPVRVPRRPGQDGLDDARTRVHAGRHRLPGRGRLPVPAGPAYRPDHLRRGQHLPGGGRGGAARTPLGGRRRGDRGARPGVGGTKWWPWYSRPPG
ncbi:hypothetical protein GCM10020001_062120 [Nonomuraea salmonea]